MSREIKNLSAYLVTDFDIGIIVKLKIVFETI